MKKLSAHELQVDTLTRYGFTARQIATQLNRTVNAIYQTRSLARKKQGLDGVIEGSRNWEKACKK